LSQALLLSIVELGGYPDFTSLYKQCGYSPMQVNSVRKARNSLKKHQPEVIVTEFNFQSDFRDRTSSIETLMASMQGSLVLPKIIVFYENEFSHQYKKVTDRFMIDCSLAFPINESDLKNSLLQLKA